MFMRVYKNHLKKIKHHLMLFTSDGKKYNLAQQSFTMITLYLVRHGKTEYNEQRRIQGHIDTPLTDEGYENAFRVAEKLRGIKFDHIYSSDLGRAFITAHIIAEKLRLENRIVRERRLREKNYGEFNGKKIDELEKAHPRQDSEFSPPGGESFSDLQKRVVGFIEELERKHNGKTELIVTHSGCIRAIAAHFGVTDIRKSAKMEVSNEYIGRIVIEKGILVSYEKLGGI